MTVFSRNAALSSLFSLHKQRLALEEGLAPEAIAAAIEDGSMVLLGNPAHPHVQPIVVGQPSRVKVNANIGTSPLNHCLQTELQKIDTAVQAGADTVMDLSIAGNLEAIRTGMLARCSAPLGTVPMYAVGQVYLDAQRDIAEMDPELLFQEIARQAEQGVDFVTVHCGLTQRGVEWAMDGSRLMGIVSRGGALLARWMRHNGKENPLLTDFDRIVDIALRHNVTLSLGDGLRPGAGCDAGDAAQFEEVLTHGRLARHALSRGVQCMIEGPGHVRLHEVASQIQTIKRLTNNAPLYVLGPLVTDTAPGYDHIAGAIGGAAAVQAGADFLCYLTPAEHLTLPDVHDVRAGVLASRIAAQAGETALGRPQAIARENAISKARVALDWEGMSQLAYDPEMVRARREPHKHEEACAMCGKFCAVKMMQP
ncbi:phosphomethylpyrimidine synthase ThiC [Desulfovibrio cuneatus]|uniref:phosphomethylpyrimidine synthase ThiC n=1 Tax=Desulfovibrio cuneatus TaxID=159728 RepID=UPI00040B25C1|nr:phosphomethylpyrimidine synthase ThiC [Desulfovibrio cuneatus]